MNEDSFLNQIAAAPRNVDHRRVYADWLEERHDPRAAVLRAQIRAIEASPDASEARREEMRETCAAVDPSWFAQIDLAPIENCAQSPGAGCPGRWEALPREPIATLTRRCPVCTATVRYHAGPPGPLMGEDPVAIRSFAERFPGDLGPFRPSPLAPPVIDRCPDPSVLPPPNPPDRPPRASPDLAGGGSSGAGRIGPIGAECEKGPLTDEEPVAILSVAARFPGDLGPIRPGPIEPPLINRNPAPPFLPPPPNPPGPTDPPPEAGPRRWWQFWRRSG